MSLGERGGRTATLEQGVALIQAHKGDLAAAVRADILDHLERSPEWHCDDLRVDLTGNRNVLGAVVIGLINSGRIVETGERRRSTAAASHGRKSNVYRLSQVSGQSRGRTSGHDPSSPQRAAGSAPKLSQLTQRGGDGRNPNTSCASGRAAVISPTGESGGESLGEIPAPKFPVEMTGGRKGAGPVGEPVPAPTLFTLNPEAQPPGHIDLDQREAA